MDAKDFFILAEREWAEEQRQEREREKQIMRGTFRSWPLIAVAVIPFGWLAFATLDVIVASAFTFILLIATLLIAEHLAAPSIFHDQD
jgi:small-conductance mechanosensitive channel